MCEYLKASRSHRLYLLSGYLCHAQDEVGSWGHEYVRSLSGEIGQEYNSRREKEEPVEDLLELVAKILPYHMSHNAGMLILVALLLFPESPCCPHLHQRSDNLNNTKPEGVLVFWCRAGGSGSAAGDREAGVAGAACGRQELWQDVLVPGFLLRVPARGR